MDAFRVVGGLFGLVAWVVLLGLQRFWRWSFGWLFKTLAAFVRGIGFDHFGVHFHPFGAVADWLESLDRNMSNALATAANASEKLAVWLFSRFGYVFKLLGREIKGLANDTLAFGTKLVRVLLPRFFRNVVKLVMRFVRYELRQARKLLRAVVRDVRRLGRFVVKSAIAHAKQLVRLARWAAGELRRHWKAIRAILKRLDGYAKKLTGKGFRNLVAAALIGLHLSWLMSNNAFLVGKWLVSLDPGAVWEFISDAVSVVTETDLCKLAAYQYDVAVLVFEPVMQSLVGLTEWVCRHDGHTLPSAVEDTPGYLLAWAPSATPPIEPQARLAPGLPLPRGVIRA